jgi:hypothetical protein
MNPVSPTFVGFRLLVRRPLIFFAEITWRWTLAVAAWALGLAFAFEYLDSLPVKTVDRLLLYTGQPVLIAQAIRRIFSGSSIRLVEAAILVAFGLAIAWIVLASLGRLAVLRSMCEELDIPTGGSHGFGSLVFLNFVRAALVLATKLAAAASLFFASSLWASTHIRFVDAARLVLVLIFVIWLAWAVLNWLLSAAAIYVIAEGKNSLDAIGSVIRLIQARTAGILATSAVFGVIHLAAFAMAAGTVLVVLPVAIARPVALPLLFAVVFAYCFVADLLYTGRLASYLFLAQGGDELPAWMAMRGAPPSPNAGAINSIDKDEVILSDAPQPA